jgi:hypothetical protein
MLFESAQFANTQPLKSCCFARFSECQGTLPSLKKTIYSVCSGTIPLQVLCTYTIPAKTCPESRQQYAHKPKYLLPWLNEIVLDILAAVYLITPKLQSIKKQVCSAESLIIIQFSTRHNSNALLQVEARTSILIPWNASSATLQCHGASGPPSSTHSRHQQFLSHLLYHCPYHPQPTPPPPTPPTPPHTPHPTPPHIPAGTST